MLFEYPIEYPIEYPKPKMAKNITVKKLNFSIKLNKNTPFAFTKALIKKAVKQRK